MHLTTRTALTAGLALGLGLTGTAAAATSTVRVDENGDGGWAFNRDASTSTPYQFTTARESIGTGSLEVLPIGATPADKFIAELPLDVATSDLSSVSYDFLVGGAGTPADANEFYLNVYTNLPGSTTFYDCRFDFVPTTGSTATWTTVTATSTSTPTNVRERVPGTCTATWDAMPAGSTVSFIALNVGDTSAGDTGLGGFYDNVVVATSTGTTTYDFEAKPASKDECKKGGWAEFGYANQGQCVSAVQANPNAGK